MGIALKIIGGYLGAGKTTLINELLVQSTEKIAVVVNDFGEVNIDAKLIRSATGDTIELTNGCICCSLGDGLGELLPRLARRRDLDAVVIEVSGVGEPGKLASWSTYPGYNRGGVLVCADAAKLSRLAVDAYVGDTIRNQLAAADVVLLTKADVATVEQLSAGRGVVSAINPAAPVLAPSRGTGRWAAINRLSPFPEAAGKAAECLQPGESAEPQKPGHSHRSRSLRTGELLDRTAILGALERAVPHLVRAKGILRLDAEDKQTVVQYSTSGLDVERGTAWMPGDSSELVLVAAGEHADADLAAALLEIGQAFPGARPGANPG